MAYRLGKLKADQITVTPSGGVSSTNLHECIKELDSEKANLISPTFTGTPLAPTPTTGDNSTRIATTEFIATKLTSFAQLDSPTFTGTPSLPSGTSGFKTINGLSVLGSGNIPLTDGLIISGGNFESQSANTFLAAPTGASGVPSFRTIVGADLTAINMGNKNILINGSFAINQTGLTSVADAAYHLDQWYALTETGNVTIAQQTNQEDGQPTSLRMTQPDVTAKRMGSAQPIESINCRDLRGQTVALRARVRCSASQAIRWAVIEWTGTADAITKDVVSSWTSGTFTTGNFFIATTTTIAATGSVTPAANTWTDLLASATISSSANNLIVFIWSEGTLAQNATLDLGLVQLAQGAQTPFEARPVGMELALAYRYAFVGSGLDIMGGAGASTVNVCAHFTLPCAMRAAPSCSITGSSSIMVSDDYTGDITSSGSTVVTNNMGTRSGRLVISGFTGLTTGRFYAGVGGTGTITFLSRL